MKSHKNELVKITKNDDGDIIEDQLWHYVINIDGSPRTVCGGEVFGEGEGAAEFIKKSVIKGGCTCTACIAIVKYYKAFKF